MFGQTGKNQRSADENSEDHRAKDAEFEVDQAVLLRRIKGRCDGVDEAPAEAEEITWG